MIDALTNGLSAMGCPTPRSVAVLVCEILPDLLVDLIILCPRCQDHMDATALVRQGVCVACVAEQA